jgi:uncharacterized phage-like protein YoqJ
MQKHYTCCFTGHRPNKLPFGYDEQDERCINLISQLKTEIETLIVNKNVTHFITGMALGIDLICAEIVIGLKEKYPFITLESAIPYEEQAANWTDNQRDRYYRIAELCDKETLLQHHYDKWCFQNRNRYMVDSSEFIIAVWNGEKSGTANTVKYAKSKNKKIIIIKT